MGSPADPGSGSGIEGAGAVIRKMRRNKKMTQPALAKRLGTDKSWLSKIENNKRPLTLGQIERLSEALGVAPVIVVLRCLEKKYPKFFATDLGRELRSHIEP
jgi:transcriptional regulator with XRE-family HTH domain